MKEEKDYERADARTWHPILSAIIGAILGGGGSLGIVFSTPIGQELTRPNPYTSADHQVYAAKTDARLDILEKHVGPDHPDQRSDYEARISENKFQIGVMAVTMTNIGAAVNKNSDKLDKLLERD